MRRHRRGWIAALLAFLFFAALGALPRFLPSQGTPAWVEAANRAAPVPLPQAASPVSAPQLSANATPMSPQDPPASAPATDPTHMAGLVAAEDQRLRTVLHHANRITVATVLSVPGALPTLVLPARPEPYGLQDLIAAGAVTPLADPGTMLLVDNVLVGPQATLHLGDQGLSRLLMNSGATGYSSLVAWGGTMTLAGQLPSIPLEITGWDQVNSQPAKDLGFGRPYIRAVGARLELTNVRASSLGFWSGRTGGVAWTGINRRPSTGSAASSEFLDNAYGAFVSRSSRVTFSDDLFEGNELDGVRLHRNANDVTVTRSASARNGGNGFVVSRGAAHDTFTADVSVHNAGNGFLLDGQPLVNGASPSGNRSTASQGVVVNGCDAEDNGRTGILVDGGTGTLVEHSLVTSPVTGIAVRARAADTSILGNEVRSGGRIALSIGPDVTGTTVDGNVLSRARIGILVRNSAGVRIMNNRLTDMSVFAISVRGASPGVVGNDNSLAGRGFQAIDVRAGASAPNLVRTDASGWQHRSEITWVGYLRYHPLLVTWLVILVLVGFCMIIARIRRSSARPYRHTVAWQSREEAERIMVGHPVLAPAAAVVESNGHAPKSEELVA